MEFDLYRFLIIAFSSSLDFWTDGWGIWELQYLKLKTLLMFSVMPFSRKQKFMWINDYYFILMNFNTAERVKRKTTQTCKRKPHIVL